MSPLPLKFDQHKRKPAQCLNLRQLLSLENFSCPKDPHQAAPASSASPPAKEVALEDALHQSLNVGESPTLNYTRQLMGF